MIFDDICLSLEFQKKTLQFLINKQISYSFPMVLTIFPWFPYGFPLKAVDVPMRFRPVRLRRSSAGSGVLGGVSEDRGCIIVQSVFYILCYNAIYNIIYIYYIILCICIYIYIYYILYHIIYIILYIQLVYNKTTTFI